jgi:hypothetical protein
VLEPAEHRAVLGLLGSDGDRPVVGTGVPDSLVARLGVDPLDENALVAAARTPSASPPRIVLSAGAEPTVRAVLDEPAIPRACVLLLGTGDADARATLEAVPWQEWPRVRYVDLEYVPPRAVEEGPGWSRLEGGLGVVVLDEGAAEWHTPCPSYVPMARLLPALRSPSVPARVIAEELESERDRRERAEAVTATVMSSRSWRITAPLRAAKRILLRGRE